MDELEFKTNVPVLALNSAVGKVTEKERRVLKITKVSFFKSHTDSEEFKTFCLKKEKYDKKNSLNRDGLIVATRTPDLPV